MTGPEASTFCDAKTPHLGFLPWAFAEGTTLECWRPSSAHPDSSPFSSISEIPRHTVNPRRLLIRKGHHIHRHIDRTSCSPILHFSWRGSPSTTRAHCGTLRGATFLPVFGQHAQRVRQGVSVACLTSISPGQQTTDSEIETRELSQLHA